MLVRDAVRQFLELGPFPASSNAAPRDLERRFNALNAIVPPVTDDEAVALLAAFGPDECFGVAWTLLHLVETAPHLPRPTQDQFARSEWLSTVWRGPR